MYDRGGEAHRHSPLTGGQAQSQGDVGLVDGDDLLPPLDVNGAEILGHWGGVIVYH